MSKLEDTITTSLIKYNIKFKRQIPVPIENYPWKTTRSRTPPKCDFYLPEFDLYIEAKGFMTYEAVSKLSYLCQQDFNYYIFQGTEKDWNPCLYSYLAVLDTNNITQQINELTMLELCEDKYLRDISWVSLTRLKDYIKKKNEQYVSWNGPLNKF